MITSHENREFDVHCLSTVYLTCHDMWVAIKNPAALAVEQKQHLQKPEKHTEIFDNANVESSDV